MGGVPGQDEASQEAPGPEATLPCDAVQGLLRHETQQNQIRPSFLIRPGSL